MTIHLFQFRFGDTEIYGGYMLRPPPYLINFWGILKLTLFWTDDKSVPEVPVRDIYQLEFSLFQSTSWSIFYMVCVFIFFLHALAGWRKLTYSDHFGIPKKHRCKVTVYGLFIFLALGFIYVSFPWFCMTFPESKGTPTATQIDLRSADRV